VKGVSAEQIVEAFRKYMDHGNTPTTRAMFEQTFAGKVANPQFTADIGPLLAPGAAWDFAAAVANVRKELIERLPGDPWKGAADKK
jgi:hypothetical protein